jgi:fructoselysine-6-P-deglycase FrlB-like protein
MLMELARMPALGFEIGQFRHGPMELLSPAAGVVLLCGEEADRPAARGLSGMALAAGASAVIFDGSGGEPLGEATTVVLPRRPDLASVLTMLPSLQRLIIAIAARRVDRVGEPVHSTKITRETS